MRTSRILSTRLAVAALLLAVDAVPQTRAPERAVAVMFDDLPATAGRPRVPTPKPPEWIGILD